jgi:hypothetical protein
MRTVTFADLDLVEHLQKHFILVWHNQSPDMGMQGVQQKYTPAQAKAYPEGGGGGNVRTYFCLPDGRVAYYLEGYWRGDSYLAEARFARGLVARLGALPEGKRQQATAEALAAHRAEVADLRRKLREQHPEEFKKKVYESEVRKRDAALGLLENTLAASAPLAAQAVEPIVRDLAMRNSLRGAIR